VLGEGNVCQPDHRVGIAGLGLARLGIGFARHCKVILLQGLVALAEQHAVAAGIHQVLPLADIGGVLILGPRRGEVGTRLCIAALAKQGHAQRAIQGRIFGVLLEGTAQQAFSCNRVARLIDHLLALCPGNPGRVAEQMLLLLQVFTGFADQWRGRVTADKRLPGPGRRAIDGQCIEVDVFALGRRVTGQRIGGQLLQYGQGFGGAVFPKQQVGQGLAQTDVAGVLFVQDLQLLDDLGVLARDVAADAQVFQGRGEIRRVIAEQLFENRRRFIRSAGSGVQPCLLQVLLALRVLQLHQALRLT